MILLPDTKGKNVDHLVIPDSHAHPKDNFRRFEALGNYIAEHKPKVIVKLGDQWDMESLSSYDKGKKSFVFRSVKADIEAGHKAEELMFNPFIKENGKKRKGRYNPTIVSIMGNHEARVDRLLEYEPRWEGSICMEDFHTRLNIKETIVPYMGFVRLDGIHYSHLWASGVMGRACSSARSMIAKKGVSCTMGHTHILDHAILTRPTGDLFRGLFAGCFMDPKNKSFGGEQVDKLYWSGILHKTQVDNGSYNLSEIGTKSLIDNWL